MHQLELAFLLTWVLSAMGYDEAVLPEIEAKPQSFFLERVCDFVEPCTALAGYDDLGIIYVHDERLDLGSKKGHGIMVHELVHYVQDIHGDYDSDSCEDSGIRERQAYELQTQYMLEIHDHAMNPIVYIHC